jgi:acetyl esterase/lipase
MRRTFVALAIASMSMITQPPAQAASRYLDPMFEVTKTSGLTYGSAFNSRTNSVQELILDLYEPTDDDSDARPAIVWVHGGSFYNGSRTSSSMVLMASEFAKRGYVTVSIDYRKLQTSGSLQSNGDLYFDSWLDRSAAIDAAQHDAQAAVRWLRANAAAYRIDAERIALGGASAGAITALQVAYNPEDPGDSGNASFPSNVAAAVSISGFAAPKDMEPLQSPALMFHGTHDTVVPFPLHEYTCDLATALLSGCEQVVYPGAGHVPMEYGADMVARTASFLCREMLAACTAPAPLPLQVFGVN